MATIFRAHNSPSLAIDGTTDHVHMLFALGRTITLAELVEDVKTSSSKWIKHKGVEFKNFHWQKGYGAFSIGQSNVAALKRYIRNQKENHRSVGFQAEYRDFLKRYEVEFDERYVWD
jgi:REP element-mobilizing transposase RayT